MELFLYDLEERVIVNDNVDEIKRKGEYLYCRTNEDWWLFPIDVIVIEDYCRSREEFIEKWQLNPIDIIDIEYEDIEEEI